MSSLVMSGAVAFFAAVLAALLVPSESLQVPLDEHVMLVSFVLLGRALRAAQKQ